MQNNTQNLLPIDMPVMAKDHILPYQVHLYIGQKRLLQISNALLEDLDLKEVAAGTLNTPMKLTCDLFCARIELSIESNDTSDRSRKRKADPDQHASLQELLSRRFFTILQQLPPRELHYLFLNICEYSGERQYWHIWNSHADKFVWGKYANVNVQMTFDETNFQTSCGLAESFYESNLRVMVRELIASNRLHYPFGEGFQVALEHDPEQCCRIAKEEALAYCNRWRS